MIELKNIDKTYNIGKANAFKALTDVSLTIEDGEMVAIIGKSGAGKSTLMHIIGCIDDFESGTYLLNGEDISKVRESTRSHIRNKDIGIVMQDFALVDDYTAIVNNPGILLADEPTGALDVKTSTEMMDVFKELNKQGITIIIITHDMEVADSCERIVEISDGRIL